MRSIHTTIAILIILLATYVSSETLVNDKRIVDKVNNDPRATWKAKQYPKFQGKTIEELKYLLGSLSPSGEALNFPRYNPKSVGPVPDIFDARKKWPACAFSIRDQQRCGSCWAFSAAQTLEDRFCVVTNNSVALSPEYILECNFSNFGCNGGYLKQVWRFLAHRGTVTEACDPYYSGQGKVHMCPISCKDKSKKKFFKADKKTVKLFGKGNVEAIQEDIFNHGTVQVTFDVYYDFYSYSSGVYQRLSDNMTGRHAVRIIGWGIDQNTTLPYWIVANSWGQDWGMNGFFWMLRGKNECNIEADVWSGRPHL